MVRDPVVIITRRRLGQQRLFRIAEGPFALLLRRRKRGAEFLLQLPDERLRRHFGAASPVAFFLDPRNHARSSLVNCPARILTQERKHLWQQV